MPVLQRGAPDSRIRPASPADAPALLAIYAPFVESTAVSFETVVPTTAEFAARIVESLATWQWLVAERQGHCIGYAYGSAHRARPAYRWSVEVSAYVRPDCHRQGVGRALYLQLFESLALKGYCNAYAGTTLPNDGSVALHQSVGFAPVGVFKAVGRKFGRWHDVAWFQKALRDAPPNGADAGQGECRVTDPSAAEPTPAELKRAIAAGELTTIQGYTVEFGPACLQLGGADELTALHYAAASGHAELVLYLLAPPINADAGAARGNQFTPLHAAAMNGHSSVCAALIRAGASVNAQTEPQGYAPLHSAAFGGHVETIRVLLASGADPALLNYRQETPADTAARAGQLAARALLGAPGR